MAELGEKSNSDLIREITDLTLEIKQKYPELYRHLASNPSVVTDSGDHMQSVFVEYLQSLRDLIAAHKAEKKRRGSL